MLQRHFHLLLGHLEHPSNADPVSTDSIRGMSYGGVLCIPQVVPRLRFHDLELVQEYSEVDLPRGSRFRSAVSPASRDAVDAPAPV